MRIVFMGTPLFAATILEELALHHEIVAVYTRPDAVRGRGKQLVSSPVKELASTLGLRVCEPSTLRDSAVQAEILACAPDVICVAAYGALLPPEVLGSARLGCLNVHASLLPRWRGAAPIERAILAGDEETGVCVMRMEEGLDTGPYCVCRTLAIEHKTAVELTDELANLGAQSLLTALVHIENDQAHWTEQNDEAATYARKLEKGELALNPAVSALVNERRIRASGATHPARCIIANRAVTVCAARPFSPNDTSSVTISNERSHVGAGLKDFALEGGNACALHKRLLLGCSEGVLEVLSLKPDGKREMSAEAFIAGCLVLREGTARWETYHA